MTTSNALTGNTTNILNVMSWIFGIAVFAAGVVNTFWGNDPFFGIFLIVLSFVYFPPINFFVYILFGYSMPWYVKILLAIFIIWAALGVGELFDKIEMMKRDAI